MKCTIIAVLVFLFSGAAFAEFKNESEAGVVITSGNSRTNTYNAKTITQYLFDKNTLRLEASYLQAKQSGVLSAENWLLGLRYERELSEKLSVFLGQSVESDPFAGFLQRYNSDLGAKYYLYKLEKNFVWFAEGGYRFTRENSTGGVHQNFQKARFYTEAEKFWSEATSTKLWVEYIPNFTVSQAWLLNGEASVASALNSTFSVKTAYLVRYNNRPPVAKADKTDTTFTTALVAKF